MPILWDRGVYFDCVRIDPFNGSMTEQQVDGQSMILDTFERTRFANWDRRWVGYALATSMHETASTMWPIEEIGQGEGMAYGKIDPETGQGYWGRGLIQITWRENYRRADSELRLGSKGSPLSCEWNANNALRPMIAAAILGVGLEEGWFRTHEDGEPETLARYFNAEKDDPYNARECVNGDKHIIPSWSHGVPIGNLIADYYMSFTAALNYASAAADEERYAEEISAIKES